MALSRQQIPFVRIQNRRLSKLSPRVRVRSDKSVFRHRGRGELEVKVLRLRGPVLVFGGRGEFEVVMGLLLSRVVDVIVQTGWFPGLVGQSAGRGVLSFVQFDVAYGIVGVARHFFICENT